MKKIILPILLALHLLVIYFRGYFLSIEFTLYPYLAAHGFLPYKNILDQHFPTLLFGPFSLPAFLTTNPWPLLAVFLGTICLTDLLFYFSLLRFKVGSPLLWLTFYIASSSYFSGNILWIETFVNLLLAAWLFLSFSRLRAARFISGFLLSQIILLRPTILPAIFFLFIGLSLPVSVLLVFGFVTGFLIPGLYLLRHGLVPDFFKLVIEFNGRYPGGALLLPAKRQVIFLSIWLAPIFYSLIKNSKVVLSLSLLLFLVLIIPRFGFEHLQPLFLVGTLVWALGKSHLKTVIFVFIIGLFGLNLVSTIRHSYGNYFLNPDVQKISQRVSELSGREVYLLGASDLIYPLSGKLPPGGIYLPSLPWYFSEPDFTTQVIKSLRDRKPPVLVDHSAIVDGLGVVESSGPIFEYIKMNYTGEARLGSYQFFTPLNQ